MAIPINVEDLLNKRKIESNRIEEAVVNALYHRDEYLNSRRYRNRRLGDYLKELQLSEGRATGIPTIQDELRKNGSEPARIETDDGRTYFLIEIPCREGFENEMDAKYGTSEAAGYKEKRIGGKNGSFCEDNITDIAESIL